MRQKLEEKELSLSTKYKQTLIIFFLLYFLLFLLYFTNPDNFRIVDIEINAESPLFINLIFSLFPEYTK